MSMRPENRAPGADSHKGAAQPDKFRDLARQLGCDEDEKAFEEKVKRIAKAPPAPVEKPK